MSFRSLNPTDFYLAQAPLDEALIPLLDCKSLFTFTFVHKNSKYSAYARILQNYIATNTNQNKWRRLLLLLHTQTHLPTVNTQSLQRALQQLAESEQSSLFDRTMIFCILLRLTDEPDLIEQRTQIFFKLLDLFPAADDLFKNSLLASYALHIKDTDKYKEYHEKHNTYFAAALQDERDFKSITFEAVTTVIAPFRYDWIEQIKKIIKNLLKNDNINATTKSSILNLVNALSFLLPRSTLIKHTEDLIKPLLPKLQSSFGSLCASNAKDVLFFLSSLPIYIPAAEAINTILGLFYPDKLSQINPDAPYYATEICTSSIASVLTQIKLPSPAMLSILLSIPYEVLDIKETNATGQQKMLEALVHAFKQLTKDDFDKLLYPRLAIFLEENKDKFFCTSLYHAILKVRPYLLTSRFMLSMVTPQINAGDITAAKRISNYLSLLEYENLQKLILELMASIQPEATSSTAKTYRKIDILVLALTQLASSNFAEFSFLDAMHPRKMILSTRYQLLLNNIPNLIDLIKNSFLHIISMKGILLSEPEKHIALCLAVYSNCDQEILKLIDAVCASIPDLSSNNNNKQQDDVHKQLAFFIYLAINLKEEFNKLNAFNAIKPRLKNTSYYFELLTLASFVNHDILQNELLALWNSLPSVEQINSQNNSYIQYELRFLVFGIHLLKNTSSQLFWINQFKGLYTACQPAHIKEGIAYRLSTIAINLPYSNKFVELVDFLSPYFHQEYYAKLLMKIDDEKILLAYIQKIIPPDLILVKPLHPKELRNATYTICHFIRYYENDNVKLYIFEWMLKQTLSSRKFNHTMCMIICEIPSLITDTKQLLRLRDLMQPLLQNTNTRLQTDAIEGWSLLIQRLPISNAEQTFKPAPK